MIQYENHKFDVSFVTNVVKRHIKDLDIIAENVETRITNVIEYLNKAFPMKTKTLKLKIYY